MNENKLTPLENNTLQGFIDKLNLPELVAGSAGKAISRLIAGICDIPSAAIDGFVQEIKNKTKARELVNNEVALAAAKMAADDPGIVTRAAYSLIAKEYRKQYNKEEIVKIAISALEEEFKFSSYSAEKVEEGAQVCFVDDDWLNVFEKHAEDASTERMQSLWGRVLAGEIRSPKAFSLKTLRFISELDQETAAIYEKYNPFFCDFGTVRILPKPNKLHGLELMEMLHLQNAGLVTGVDGLLSQNLEFTENCISFVNQGKHIALEADKGVSINIPSIFTTDIGREVSTLVSAPFNKERLDQVVERLQNTKINRISVATLVGQNMLQIDKVLWQSVRNRK